MTSSLTIGAWLATYAVHSTILLGARNIPRATWAFALAAEEFPRDVRALLNLAAMYEEAGKKDLERATLRRVLAVDPANTSATARLRALSG